MSENVATPKLTKLVYIEPDTIPDAGDYNALVDVVNAMAELANAFFATAEYRDEIVISAVGEDGERKNIAAIGDDGKIIIYD